MTTRLEKPIRRELDAATMGVRYGMGSGATLIVIETSRAGVSFREKGKRFTLTLPWRDAYRLAESLAGERRRQEKLREAALARHARGRV